MNVEQRNKWIVDNAAWFANRVKSYSDKYGVDFDELYSDCSVELIKLLDRWEDEPTKTAISVRICGYLGRACEKALKEKEEEPVGLEFEMIYEPDFNKEVWKESIKRRCHLTDREIRVFMGHTFGDETFNDIAKEYSVTISRIQQINNKASWKVYRYLFSEPCFYYLWRYVGIATIDHRVEVPIRGFVRTIHNDPEEAIEVIKKRFTDCDEEVELDFTDEWCELHMCSIGESRRSNLDGYLWRK